MDGDGHDQELRGLDDEITEVEVIRLVSKDNVPFEIPKLCIAQSAYLKGIVEMDSSAQDVALEHVSTVALTKIVEYLIYHSENVPRPIPRPLKNSNLRNTVGSWDADFVECELDLVFDILLCANFMSIQSLLELCCAKIASMMLGKTPKQIRRSFGVPEDFSPEEEEQIRNEFSEFL